MIIDADAHVVETPHTWAYLEGSDKKYRPQLFQSAENPAAQYWFLEPKPGSERIDKKENSRGQPADGVRPVAILDTATLLSTGFGFSECSVVTPLSL